MRREVPRHCLSCVRHRKVAAFYRGFAWLMVCVVCVIWNSSQNNFVKRVVKISSKETQVFNEDQNQFRM